jgi:hypothetical protein
MTRSTTVLSGTYRGACARLEGIAPTVSEEAWRAGEALNARLAALSGEDFRGPEKARRVQALLAGHPLDVLLAANILQCRDDLASRCTNAKNGG